MKKLFLSVLITAVFGSSLSAQEQQRVELESFERCNNWARHYCQSGNHEAAVNRRLQQLKKRGYVITNALIKSYSQKIRPDTPAPRAAQ